MLSTDKVRFVGDPIACVVAETIAQAKDASEAIEVDIEPLPVVTKPDQAVAERRAGDLRRRAGQRRARFPLRRREKVSAAFAGAAHKVKLKLINTRLVVNAIEPRAAIGSYDKAKERYTLHSVQPGRDGAEGRHCRRDEDHAGQDARHHRQCRRLVRHEGRGLSGICLHPARARRCSAVR